MESGSHKQESSGSGSGSSSQNRESGGSHSKDQHSSSKGDSSSSSNPAGSQESGKSNTSAQKESAAGVDGVLSATVDDNSNEWRNGHGSGGGSKGDGGNSGGGSGSGNANNTSGGGSNSNSNANGGSGNSGSGDRDHYEPSTSFAEEDDDGVRPSDLYGKFTWKIENFSEISKRELRSNVFEVGEYKWYILVYPQGCDVSNHLSLFLCVADYDKLLPGWSHFAQFTIAVVNKDPKKSKYSDTLHRFCKKEHDWGWKKFMELSKVLDGFTVSDTLVIKAQVQVIREKQNRPFRCLDTQYRRELVRVYLTNVEGICRRFMEERREKLAKLRECPESFREFWTSLSTQLRSCLASDRADNILKLLVKRFFNEKEVTSTLVMDALHSGYKALDVDQKRITSGSGEGSDNPAGVGETNTNASTDIVNSIANMSMDNQKEGSPSLPPVCVSMEQNLTYLTGDVMKTLEAAANETLPPNSEDKDGLDEYGKDSVERDERRLAELGRQAIEMFVLSHLYINRIEVAFKENEALKRQEALIREEEEAERMEEERVQKKAEAERERRNRRKEKKQRKKEKREAEEAALEAERLAVEEVKRKEEEEARRLREEAAEKERKAKEEARQVALAAAREKERERKAAKKAALEEEKKKKAQEQAQELKDKANKPTSRPMEEDREVLERKAAAEEEKRREELIEELKQQLQQKDMLILQLQTKLRETESALEAEREARMKEAAAAAAAAATAAATAATAEKQLKEAREKASVAMQGSMNGNMMMFSSPVRQTAPQNHQDNTGLDDFAHMGLITDLLE